MAKANMPRSFLSVSLPSAAYNSSSNSVSDPPRSTIPRARSRCASSA
jgi:hypothetical protein